MKLFLIPSSKGFYFRDVEKDKANKKKFFGKKILKIRRHNITLKGSTALKAKFHSPHPSILSLSSFNQLLNIERRDVSFYSRCRNHDNTTFVYPIRQLNNFNLKYASKI